MTAVDDNTPWQDISSSSTPSRSPSWKKWAAAAALVFGAATIASTGGMIPTPPTIPPAGAAAFTMTSLVGPQTTLNGVTVTCGTAPYSTGWTVIDPNAAGADLYRDLFTNGTIGEKFCLKAGTHRLTEQIALKNNMEIVGEKGAIIDGGVVLTGWTNVTVGGQSLWKATIPFQITKRSTNPANRCSGVENGTPTGSGATAAEAKANSDWPWEPNCIDLWDVWADGQWVEPEEWKPASSGGALCPSPLPSRTSADRWWPKPGADYVNPEDPTSSVYNTSKTCVGLDSHDANAYAGTPAADPYEYAVQINGSSDDFVYLGFNPTGKEIVMSRPFAGKFGLSDRKSGETHEPTCPSTGTDFCGNDVKISNIVIQHVGVQEQDGAIDAQNGRWTLKQVEARYNHGIGINLYGGEVSYSISHHNGQLQFGAKGADKISMRSDKQSTWHHNEAHSANLARYWVGWEGGLTKYSKTTGQIFEYNYMHDGPQAGVWFDINNRGVPSSESTTNWLNTESKRSRVANNWITNQGQYADQTTDYPLSGSQSVGRGIFLEIGCEALVENNTVVQVGIDATGDALNRGPSANAGIWITESHSNIVRNNTVDSSALGIIVTDKGRDDQNGRCSTNNLSNTTDTCAGALVASPTPGQPPTCDKSRDRIHMPFDNVISNNKIRMTIGTGGESSGLRPATGLDANVGDNNHTGRWTPGYGLTSRCSTRPNGDPYDIDCDRWMEAFEPTPDSGELFSSTSVVQVGRSPNTWIGNDYWLPGSGATCSGNLFRWQKFLSSNTGTSPYEGTATMDNYPWSKWTAAYNAAGNASSVWVYAGQDVGGNCYPQDSTEDEPACVLRTPGIFSPTKYTFTPAAATVDVWVKVDPSEFYKDRFWYIPPTGCAEVKQANSAGSTWVKVADNRAFSGTDVFGLSRWDNDVMVEKVVTVPSGCNATSDPEAECSETTLTGTAAFDDTGYSAPTPPPTP